MRNLIVAIAVSAALPMSVSAQSFQPGGQYSNDDRRVSVGLTIPFGGGGSRAERDPRVDLVFDHLQRDANGFEAKQLTNLKSHRPVRLGLSLSKEPHLMLNGRVIARAHGQHHISTVAWVGIGAAVLGAGALIAYDALDDASQ